MSSDLLQRLRVATAPLHGALERHVVMQRILSGTVTRRLYGLYLRNLHPLYAALERGLACRGGEPAIATFNDPSLFRATAIERDLESLVGPDWVALDWVPSARTYATKIETLARERPVLLGAHAYVRYLGDLSGGRVVRNRVAAALALDSSHADHEGLSFYAFDTPPTPLAQRLRAALQTLDLGEDTGDAFVAEAVSGFARHGAVFDELATLAGQSLPVN